MDILSLSTDYNPNYVAKVFKVTEVINHPNADRLKIVVMGGENIITASSVAVGDMYVYFPIESQISGKFLSWTNSFENTSLNKDKSVKGYFDPKGRVRMIKLRGVYSHGYLVPASTLEGFILAEYSVKVDLSSYNNVEFDTILGDKFVNKYVIRSVNSKSGASKSSLTILEPKFSRVIKGQFPAHGKTLHFRRNLHILNPTDVIEVSEKIHGQSWRVGKVLVNKKLTLAQCVIAKIAKFFGCEVQDTEYGLMYGSRETIRSQTSDPPRVPNQFSVVADAIYPTLTPGVTLYGEVYGFAPNGAYLQKNYDYGCLPNCLDFCVYRGCFIDKDGLIYEMSFSQLRHYCHQRGLKTPLLHFYGAAKDMFPDIVIDENWNTNFLKRLEKEYLDKDCSLCNNKVPNEGVVIRIENPFLWTALKLKSNRFLQKETEDLDGNEEIAE